MRIAIYQITSGAKSILHVSPENEHPRDSGSASGAASKLAGGGWGSGRQESIVLGRINVCEVHKNLPFGHKFAFLCLNCLV